MAYGDARSSHRHTKLTRDAAALLGFKAPSFTFETDLFLPVKANEDLRNALSNDLRNDEAGADKDEVALQAVKTLELMDYFTIPQVRWAVLDRLKRWAGGGRTSGGFEDGTLHRLCVFYAQCISEVQPSWSWPKLGNIIGANLDIA